MDGSEIILYNNLNVNNFFIFCKDFYCPLGNTLSYLNSLFFTDSDAFNLYQCIERKAGYFHGGSGRFVTAEFLAIGIIHNGEIIHTFQKDGRFDNVFQIQVGGI